jgi:serine/threonine protein kinase
LIPTKQIQSSAHPDNPHHFELKNTETEGQNSEITTERPKGVDTPDQFKEVAGESQRIVGTPDYIAIEVILGKVSTGLNRNKMLDWWSLGIIVYELVVGVTPFSSDVSREVVFENIEKGDIEWPDIGSFCNWLKFFRV